MTVFAATNITSEGIAATTSVESDCFAPYGAQRHVRMETFINSMWMNPQEARVLAANLLAAADAADAANAADEALFVS